MYQNQKQTILLLSHEAMNFVSSSHNQGNDPQKGCNDHPEQPGRSLLLFRNNKAKIPAGI
jgi:hypothetical protein